MRARAVALSFAILIVAVSGYGQGIVIDSFGHNGELSCTNLQPGSTCTVEWASSLEGPWTNTWEALSNVVVGSNGTITVSVPMFYQVRGVAATAAPSGMVLIPSGSNSGANPLGSGESYGDRYPQNYSLTVASFYMDRYEVSKALWDEVRNAPQTVARGYTDLATGLGKASNHPVHTVSWYDVVKWCNARSQKDGRTPAYYTDAGLTQIYKTGQVSEPHVNTSANGYRLPTDAQWEYAARGGLASKRFPWGGDTISHSQANYYAYNSSDYDLSSGGNHETYFTGGTPYTSPVGAFETGKNAYGLYDMAGNVWEWCYDWSPGNEGSYRVLRGGCSGNNADYCRVAYRYDSYPGDAGPGVGFRACVPPGQ